MAICLIGDAVFPYDSCSANIASYGHLGSQRYEFPSTNFRVYVLKKESGCTWIAPGTAILSYESSPGTWTELGRLTSDSGFGYVYIWMDIVNPGNTKWKIVWNECTKEFTSGTPPTTDIFDVAISTINNATGIPISSQGILINGIEYTSDTGGNVLLSYSYKVIPGVYQTYVATNDELLNGVYMKVKNNTGLDSYYGTIHLYHIVGDPYDPFAMWDSRPPFNQPIWRNGDVRFFRLRGWIDPYAGSPTANYTITSFEASSDVGSSFSWSIIYAKKLNITLSGPGKICTSGCGSYTLLNDTTNITLNVCTPNWQCEQPLNGYENDGCGNRRLSAVCNPCIPDWQCRQPLDGYETDVNNCGEPDRIRADGTCNAVVQEGIGDLGTVIIAGIAIGAMMSMSSGTFMSTRKI